MWRERPIGRMPGVPDDRSARALAVRAPLQAVAGALLGSWVALAMSASTPDYSATLDRMWDFDAPDISEQRFRAELAKQPAGSREALEAATQVARTQGLQRRFDAADALLDEVEHQLEAAPPRVRVRYLLERGRTRNSGGQAPRAVPLFAEALRESGRDTLPDAAFYRIDALHMLGIAAPAPERLEWNRKALAAAEAATEARARSWRGSLLNNLGWTEHARGNFAEALTLWERALAAREAAGDTSRARIARWTVARGLRSLRRFEEAEKIQLGLARETEDAEAPDGYVYEELAELALARDDAIGARGWAAKAHPLLAADAGLAASEPARLARLATLAGLAP